MMGKNISHIYNKNIMDPKEMVRIPCRIESSHIPDFKDWVASLNELGYPASILNNIGKICDYCNVELDMNEDYEFECINCHVKHDRCQNCQEKMQDKPVECPGL